MKVRATYVFEFEPDTSDMDAFVDKKCIAEDLTRMEIQEELNNDNISADDFTYEVIDDNDDHRID